MKRDEWMPLLSGYATGTLSAEERSRLLAAALEDQQLFDALADEEALRELLSDAENRGYLREALAESDDAPQNGEPVLSRQRTAARPVAVVPASGPGAAPPAGAPVEPGESGPGEPRAPRRRWTWGLAMAASLVVATVAGWRLLHPPAETSTEVASSRQPAAPEVAPPAVSTDAPPSLRNAPAEPKPGSRQPAPDQRKAQASRPGQPAGALGRAPAPFDQRANQAVEQEKAMAKQEGESRVERKESAPQTPPEPPGNRMRNQAPGPPAQPEASKAAQQELPKAAPEEVRPQEVRKDAPSSSPARPLATPPARRDAAPAPAPPPAPVSGASGAASSAAMAKTPPRPARSPERASQLYQSASRANPGFAGGVRLPQASLPHFGIRYQLLRRLPNGSTTPAAWTETFTPGEPLMLVVQANVPADLRVEVRGQPEANPSSRELAVFFAFAPGATVEISARPVGLSAAVAEIELRRESVGGFEYAVDPTPGLSRAIRVKLFFRP